MDYRGVGASEGAVDPDRLAQDARAMWAAAVELARKREGRIGLRGASLGTLAIAAILEQDAEPGGVVMTAPVDARTIVSRAAEARLGGVPAFFARPFWRGPRVPGLADTLSEAACPTFVVLPREDPLFPRDEAEAVVASASEHVQVVRMEWDHERLVLRTYGFELKDDSGSVVAVLMEAEEAFLLALLGRHE
jgi:pimeloyl-ACP methyl ester carboxylesterase